MNGKTLLKLTLLLTPLLLAIWLASLRPPAASAAGPCPPLPQPGGTIVSVSTTAELQAAVANLTDNTTILIADGTYDLTQTLVVDGGRQNVAIRGASGDPTRVVLRGRGMSNAAYGSVPHAILVRQAAGVLIADLSIRDAYFHNIQIQGEQGAQRVEMINLHLLDAGEQLVKVSTAGPPGPYADDGLLACSLLAYTDRARSWYTNGIDILAGANWTIRDNLFRNIRAPIGQLAGPAVLVWRNSLNTTVERNLFVDCDRAIALGLSAPDGNARDGETVYDHQGGVIRNNMIWRAPGSPTGDVGITVNYAREFKIYHNTVMLNDTFPWTIEYRFAASSGRVVNNLSDGPIQPRDGGAAVLEGNLTGAEAGWFVDAAAGDLHLRSTAAAAVDQGVSLPAVIDDFDGSPRPQGPTPDVGADELDGPPFSPSAWLFLPHAAR